MIHTEVVAETIPFSLLSAVIPRTDESIRQASRSVGDGYLHQLSKDTEAKLNAALEAYTKDFLKTK